MHWCSILAVGWQIYLSKKLMQLCLGNTLTHVSNFLCAVTQVEKPQEMCARSTHCPHRHLLWPLHCGKSPCLPFYSSQWPRIEPVIRDQKQLNPSLLWIVIQSEGTGVYWRFKCHQKLKYDDTKYFMNPMSNPGLKLLILIVVIRKCDNHSAQSPPARPNLLSTFLRGIWCFSWFYDF